MLGKFSRTALLAILLAVILGPLGLKPVAACHSILHVIDADTGAHLTSCGRPIYGVYNHRSRWLGDGDWFGGGTGTYRFTYSRPCRGYILDHWDVESDVVSNVIRGRNYIQFDLGSGNADVYLYLRKPKLTVRVDPPGSGDVHPYGKGTHRIDAGRRIRLYPRPNAGWEFDYWTVDGRRVESEYLALVMNSDHEVVAHFVESAKPPASLGTIPVASPVIRACEAYPDGWPYSAKYRGLLIDVSFNGDLLRNLSGPAQYWEWDNVLVVGALTANPQPWTKLGVMIDREEGFLSIKGKKYWAIEGEVDYGVIYLRCGVNFTTWAAGVTRYGTRAALMWLLNHPNDMKKHLLVAVEWIDSNGNGLVEDSEIRVIYTLP